MQRKLLSKLTAIALLSLLLLIALSLIEGQIGARKSRQDEVRRDVAASASGPQTLTGPVLLIHYRERIEKRDKDAAGNEILRHELVARSRIVPAQRLDLDGALRVETLRRGLYRARLFHLDGRVTGQFSLPANLGLNEAQRIVDAEAYLVLGLSDPRGLRNDPELRIDGQPRAVSTGTAGALPGTGLHAPLGRIDPHQALRFEFSLPLRLAGSERLAVAPTADSTQLTLASDWPHPSFQGRFLPSERQVTTQGFTAHWQISHLARDFERALQAGKGAADAEVLEISLIEPVNVYLKAERAVKYGILFITLTFAAFFFTETLRRLPIHPMQYLLVGLALAMFFLLLIALSEHIDFFVAYLVSAAACVLLIGGYLAGALASRLHGLAFGLGLAALYGVLYGVLLSEDNALLMGTMLLFAALASAMLATRRLDWYRLTAANEESKAPND